MKFKYACYIEISKESRKHLELLGYDLLFSARNELADLLLASQCGVAVAAIACNIPDDAINCMGNLDLFKAVSAMREDSDFRQIFIDDNSTIIRCMRSDISIFSEYINPRKLSLEELQERFKEKEK